MTMTEPRDENGQYVSLGALFERQRQEHMKDHERETSVAKDTAARLSSEVKAALITVSDTAHLHAVAHKEQHDAHERIHGVEKIQVDKALLAEGETRGQHGVAHRNEHDAHERVHIVEKAQVNKAEEAMNTRLKSMNEFRDTLRDQNSTFVTRESYEERHEALKNRVYLMEKRIAYYSGFAAAAGAAIAYVIRVATS